MKRDDMVNAPPHYRQGDIECIDAIKAALTPEEFRGYCKGSVIGYVWREKYKGGDESLEKSVWYLNRALAQKEIEAERSEAVCRGLTADYIAALDKRYPSEPYMTREDQEEFLRGRSTL